jgi:hypothetical protein
MKILEEQHRELTEKYRGTEQLNTKLRTDVYKFKQKIKVIRYFPHRITNFTIVLTKIHLHFAVQSKRRRTQWC